MNLTVRSENPTRKSNEQQIAQNIVWKGHSAWPAQICSPPEHLKKPKDAQKLKCVCFFGTFDL